MVVINLEVPDALIIQRLSGRISCEKCSAPYHREGNPPKQEGICDRCQGKLIQREDDKEEVIRKRLEVYHKQTAPLKAYYREKGKLLEIDGAQSKEFTEKSIDSALKVLLPSR
jgi:adenylate kinase